MPIVRLTPHDLPDALRKHIERRMAEVRAAANEVAQRGAFEARWMAQQEDIPDQGDYHNSFKAIPTATGAALINTAPHAVYVEHGRRPGAPMPPEQPIADWARRKLGVEDRHAVWLIRKKIAEKGIKPRWIMKRMASWMKKLFVLETRRILSR